MIVWLSVNAPTCAARKVPVCSWEAHDELLLPHDTRNMRERAVRVHHCPVLRVEKDYE